MFRDSLSRKEKLLVIILPAKTFCKNRKNIYTDSPLCLPLIIYTIKVKKVDVSVQCLNHFLNTIPIHCKKKRDCFSIWYKAFLFT